MRNLSYIVILIVGMIAGMWLCRQFCLPERTVEIQRDTVTFIDTLIIDRPVLIKEEVVNNMLVPIHDTTTIHDTTYIVLPRELKVYSGDEYYAEVSGYQPSLDYIEVYPKNVVVSKMEIPTEKRNYLSAGVEAGWCSTFSIPIYLEYGRMLHKNVKFSGGVFRDLVKQENGVRFGIEAQIGW